MLILRRTPIRLRLTLWYVTLLAVVLAVFAIGTYSIMRRALYDNLREAVVSRGDGFLEVIQYEGLRPVLPPERSQATLNQREYFVRLFDDAGLISFDNSAAFGTVTVDAAVLERALRGRSTTRSIQTLADDDVIFVVARPIRRDSAIAGVIEIGQYDDDASDPLKQLLLILGVVYPITLLGASFGGLFLAGRALSPMDKITRTAHTMSAEDLSQRLNLNLPDDEVGRLARTFDEMIGRLDYAFQRQRQFTADVSHELMTPLTIIKGQIEVSRNRERQPAEYATVLETVNEAVDRLIRLAGSLLNLTRANAGQIPLEFEAVDVGETVAGVYEQLSPTAAEKGLEFYLDSGPPATLSADQDLVLQLLLNLLDNAIRYTLPGGRVTVGWSLNNGQVSLKVQDTGIGIAAEHLPHLFDRFYRVNPARDRTEGGVGLGLAICRWIAEAHGGWIRIDSTPGKGSTFTVTLPTSR